VVALETTMVEDKEFSILTELLMVQLLKLDSIAADGEAKVQRRAEVSDDNYDIFGNADSKVVVRSDI